VTPSERAIAREAPNGGVEVLTADGMGFPFLGTWTCLRFGAFLSLGTSNPAIRCVGLVI
jgi:hypothetical protein